MAWELARGFAVVQRRLTNGEIAELLFVSVPDCGDAGLVAAAQAGSDQPSGFFVAT